MSDDKSTKPDQPPPPIVKEKPREIADRVFVIPDGKVPLVPNVGIIVGERAALVVDCGMGTRNGDHVREVASKLAGGLPLYLTLTHFHPEHGFGAAAFAAETIVYNRVQYEELREKGPHFLQEFRSFGGPIAECLEGVGKFVEPHLLYDRRLDVDLGGRQVQLRTWGTAHTRGDQTIFLPEEEILFTGDLAEDGFFPIFAPEDPDVDDQKWVLVLEQLRALRPAQVVPGHGEIGDVERLDVDERFLRQVRDETERLAAAGKDRDAIVAELGPKWKSEHPDWDTSEPWRIVTAVSSVLASVT